MVYIVRLFVSYRPIDLHLTQGVAVLVVPGAFPTCLMTGVFIRASVTELEPGADQTYIEDVRISICILNVC